jgi:ubiquinone/menaquinone biosynthesis C-methylase UbiE
MTDTDPDLTAAYALETPEDSKRLYADWAESYDSTFAKDMDYRMPQVIARIYAEVAQGAQPVLDVGAGTGLFVQDLPPHDGVQIDALDISAEMLAVAAKRGVYRNFLQYDLTQRLPIEDATYGALVSAGTFTHGHVGPDALDELMRIAKPGAVFVLGINAEHFESRGFAAKFEALAPDIENMEMRDLPIYGPDTDAAHKDDLARVAIFKRR